MLLCWERLSEAANCGSANFDANDSQKTSPGPSALFKEKKKKRRRNKVLFYLKKAREKE